ncbi:MAG: DUF1385 domain-containing protein [Eubacteriales bacterium]|nr:DUF1385 domain-containing protein [Eubacteriales bacterium]
MKKNTQQMTCRLNRVGGEAVIEGVMMKCKDNCCTACRDEKGKIKVHERTFVSIRKKVKFFNLPLIRGVVSFIESMILSFFVLNISAEVMGGEEMQKESKFEKWMKKHLGVGIFDIIMVIAAILGVALALFLFLYLPTKAGELFSVLLFGRNGADGNSHPIIISAIEGVIKIAIFILYMFLVSLMPSIRRVFEYHGAEHKSIACFESGEELTPEKAKEYTRFHPRCGTSFMFVMIILGVLIGFAIHLAFPNFKGIAYAATRLLLLPVVVGLGFEFIMYAGKHNNVFTRALSAPGLWMQRITTREPDLEELEVAITALKFSMPDEFPDFDRASFERIVSEKSKKTDPTDEKPKSDADDIRGKK